jgi:outer membrane protein OmpA-like peptidoglycan-associated protein
MVKMRSLISAFALGMVIAPTAAAELKIDLAGDFYNGAPAFEVIADDKVVSAGTVSDPSGDEITVEVGNASAIGIRFFNDAVGPLDSEGYPAPGADRNLVIRSIEFNGGRILGKDLPTGRGRVVRGDYMVVATNQLVEIPFAGMGDIVATNDAEKIEAAIVNDQNEIRGSSCDLEVQVTGYANGAVNPRSEQQAQLEDVFRAADCDIIVTGYSSSAGPTDANKRIAEQRAQAVLDFLRAQGAEFTNEEVVGFGETTDYGGTQAANRRVVVQLY